MTSPREDWANRGIEIGPVRYDGVAQSMGCHGEYVDQVVQLQPALERAVQSGKPSQQIAEYDLVARPIIELPADSPAHCAVRGIVESRVLA